MTRVPRALARGLALAQSLFFRAQGGTAKKNEGPGTHCLCMRQKVTDFWTFSDIFVIINGRGEL